MVNQKNQKLGRYKLLRSLYTFLGYLSLLGSIVFVILYNVPLIKINLTVEHLSILILTVGLFLYFRINSLHYHSLVFLMENTSIRSGDVYKPMERKLRSKY